MFSIIITIIITLLICAACLVYVGYKHTENEKIQTNYTGPYIRAPIVVTHSKKRKCKNKNNNKK